MPEPSYRQSAQLHDQTQPSGLDPDVKALQARVKELEAAVSAQALKPGPLDAKLESQESLTRRYAEVRERNMRNMLPESRFRAAARGDLGDATAADEIARLRADNAELIKRLSTLETIVLERETAPAGKGPKGK